MYAGRRVAVVMPAFNEAGLIREAVARVPAFVDRLFVVDDASTDPTAERVCALRRNGLTLLRHETNQGVGAAIRTVYRAALQHDIAIVAVMAGDAQMDPRDLPALLEAVVAGAGYAKGNRFAWPGPERIPPARYAGGALFSLLTRPASGCWHVFDSQCGYTAISREALVSIELSRLWPRFGYPNDLISAMHAAGVRIVDVPVRPVYNGEYSGIGAKVVLGVMPGVLWRCRRWRNGGG